MFSGKLSCSFCGRRASEVEKLVAGPRRLFGRVYICDRCVTQTVAIMSSSGAEVTEPHGRD